MKEICSNPICNIDWHIFARETEVDEETKSVAYTDTCKRCGIVKNMTIIPSDYLKHKEKIWTNY